MGIGDNIVANNFMFCRDHGLEYCMICCCDHRMCNNIAIEDDIADLSEDFDFDERKPINVFQIGVLVRRRTVEDLECLAHKKDDCERCFNWVKVVRAEAQEAANTERWLEKRKKYMDKVDA